MATAISSTFDIITEVAAGVTVVNVAKPNRTCRCVGIYGTGLDTAVITVSKVATLGTGAATSMGVATLTALVAGIVDAPAILSTVAGARDLLADDWIRIARTNANSTRIVLRFAATGGGEALTES